MRPLTESKLRWDETLKASASFADLQRAVKFNGPNSPCVAGCRSVCWKVGILFSVIALPGRLCSNKQQAFLLFQDASSANWSHVLLESRNTYSALREHYLRYVKHPEQLAELELDPLADDPEVGKPGRWPTGRFADATSVTMGRLSTR
jgi:TBC1 domain family member 5